MEKDLAVATSCGFAEAGPFTVSSEEFLRQADTALYMAKASGRGRWQFYDESAHAIDMRRVKLERLLLNEDAVNELTVQYQPIYWMHDNGIAYVEALARWKSAELGQIKPNEFISLAESLGRIEPLNDAILEKALMQIGDWRPDIRLSFNLSAAQISRRGATAHLLRILEGYGIPPERLLFEIRESAVLADLSVAKHELERLRGAGCLTALDDFGAGHASVSYLRDLEFDVVKLDGSLTEKVCFAQSPDRSCWA
ncbi:MAG: EAL domain-containing protein [Sphingopyxis sp.]|nr:EAL domain-containing protein [Sphingopyxis sp.]